MNSNELLKILDETKANRILLLCHQNSDPDAVCSAYALQGLLEKMRPNLTIEIGTGQGVSRLTRNLFSYFPVKVNLQPNVENAQTIVLLDTNTLQQLNGLAERVRKTKAPIIVVDHHTAHPETELVSKLCITKEEAPSTCNIIYDFYNEQGIKPNLNQARALFLGIAFDTRHFVLANSSTFKAIADLVDCGVNAQEALRMLALPMDLSERVARVKACRRSKVIRIENWIMAFSHVSAFQASAARALLDIGAHVSVVAGNKGENLEISLRCTHEFTEKTGIHLGKDIAKPIGEAMRGQGGGHAMAAGINAKGDIERGLKYSLSLLREKLTKIE
jgi:nanoRNase/pAp phosphatase (c-di-AMP/oligoRNAs hydrolase)